MATRRGCWKAICKSTRASRHWSFPARKHGADKLAKVLAGWGFKVGAIHGNRSQNQRDRILTEFKAGEVDVLVATDVAARGIDIPTVRHVYNYDMPNVPENYVHRIGRTARAGPKAPRSASAHRPRWASCRRSRSC
jgi:superfamily II DNA/RNA helicase